MNWLLFIALHYYGLISNHDTYGSKRSQSTGAKQQPRNANDKDISLSFWFRRVYSKGVSNVNNRQIFFIFCLSLFFFCVELTFVLPWCRTFIFDKDKCLWNLNEVSECWAQLGTEDVENWFRLLLSVCLAWRCFKKTLYSLSHPSFSFSLCLAVHFLNRPAYESLA